VGNAVVVGFVSFRRLGCADKRDPRRFGARGPSVAPLMKGCGVVETPASGGTTRWVALGFAVVRGRVWVSLDPLGTGDGMTNFAPPGGLQSRAAFFWAAW
jgi:hypothetical protein